MTTIKTPADYLKAEALWAEAHDLMVERETAEAPAAKIEAARREMLRLENLLRAAEAQG